MEVVHRLLLVFTVFDELLRVGSDGLQANELGNQHVRNGFDVASDLAVDKFRVWILLNVDCSEEHSFKIGLEFDRRFLGLQALHLRVLLSLLHVDVD